MVIGCGALHLCKDSFLPSERFNTSYSQIPPWCGKWETERGETWFSNGEDPQLWKIENRKRSRKCSEKKVTKYMKFLRPFTCLKCKNRQTWWQRFVTEHGVPVPCQCSRYSPWSHNSCWNGASHLRPPPLTLAWWAVTVLVAGSGHVCGHMSEDDLSWHLWHFALKF